MAYFDANGLTFYITVDGDELVAICKELDVNFKKDVDEMKILQSYDKIKSVFFRAEDYNKLLVEYQTEHGIALIEMTQGTYGNTIEQRYVKTLENKLENMLRENIVSGDEFDSLFKNYYNTTSCQRNKIAKYMTAQQPK